MKQVIFWTSRVGAFFLAVHLAFADKPPLDVGAFDKWSSVSSGALTADGRYGMYVTRNPAADGNILVIKAVQGGWKAELPGASAAEFSQDNRLAIYRTKDDQLCLATLGTSNVETIPQVSGFKVSGDRLIYQLKAPEQNLVLRNLKTGKRDTFKAVKGYLVNEDWSALILQHETKNGETVTHSLSWVSLPKMKKLDIWQGSQASNLVLDTAAKQLMFMAEDKKGEETVRSVWHYALGNAKASLLMAASPAGIDPKFKADQKPVWRFSKGGERFFFGLAEKAAASKPNPDAVKLDVWSYTDAKIQSSQLNAIDPKNKYGMLDSAPGGSAVIYLDTKRIVQLSAAGEKIQFAGGDADDMALITQQDGDYSEAYWSRAAQITTHVVSTKTGERKRLEAEFKSPYFSPGGHYLTFSDPLRRNYFAQERGTGTVRDIAKDLPVPWIDRDYDSNPLPPPREIRLAAWLEKDKAVLFYDKYDIWQLDPQAKAAPINVTRGIGRKRNIEFRLLNRGNEKGISETATLTLEARDLTTQDRGFYRVTLGKQNEPQKLVMGPHNYEFVNVPGKQATTAQKYYLIQRSSAAESRNYFVTGDFKTFVPLSEVYPERAYNWLTAELIAWKALDGRQLQGAVYKPENFDPKRKYPVIIEYYEKKAEKIHDYQAPQACPGWINVPWFVSNGYVVVNPDIHYTIGETGDSVINSVVSVAKYIQQFPWVDPQRMAIQGHSMGGYETNYLVTHTQLFAAAVSAAGPSNLTSIYGALSHGEKSVQHFLETHQLRIGTTPWEKPDVYIRNSPLFSVDKVTTPLLMMHNKGDTAVTFAQGVEFFSALRRLGKTVWMLQYDGEEHSMGHSPEGKKAALDYTIRMTQFFDYYLKGAPAPKWMLEGIPARLKGVELGLELDNTGKAPGPGLYMGK